MGVLGLAIYVCVAYLAAGLFLLLAGPWQAQEVGDGPNRPLWLVALTYGVALVGLVVCARVCLRWIRGR